MWMAGGIDDVELGKSITVLSGGTEPLPLGEPADRSLMGISGWTPGARSGRMGIALPLNDVQGPTIHRGQVRIVYPRANAISQWSFV